MLITILLTATGLTLYMSGFMAFFRSLKGSPFIKRAFCSLLWPIMVVSFMLGWKLF